MLSELINYKYYTESYGGSSIPEPPFKKISIEASSMVNYYSQNRINENNINDNIRNAVCEIAELLFKQEQLIAKQDDDKLTVASETVGPHSKTYTNKSGLQSQRILKRSELEQECYQLCIRHFGYTGLLCRRIY